MLAVIRDGDGVVVDGSFCCIIDFGKDDLVHEGAEAEVCRALGVVLGVSEVRLISFCQCCNRICRRCVWWW